MVTRSDLDRALSAHGRYIALILTALETGVCDLKVDQVQSDTLCDLGHWLAGLPPAECHPTHFPAVTRHHHRFHLETAAILTLALAGKRAEVMAAMGPASAFHQASGDLAKALGDWKDELH